jgi:hypothetical protein
LVYIVSELIEGESLCELDWRRTRRESCIAI